MTLSCSSPYKSNTYGPGIFISRVTIIKAEDISGKVIPYLDNPFDIAVKLTLDIGKEFHPELTIGGMFKRDLETGEVVGWGSGFIVQDALAKLGFTGTLEQHNRLPKQAIDSLVGKEFLRLSYVSGLRDGGKPKYSDWNMISSVDEGPDALLERFKKSLTKGYPRNYHPEILDGSHREEELVPAHRNDTF
jgi:hypothetical protein